MEKLKNIITIIACPINLSSSQYYQVNHHPKLTSKDLFLFLHYSQVSSNVAFSISTHPLLLDFLSNFISNVCLGSSLNLFYPFFSLPLVSLLQMSLASSSLQTFCSSLKMSRVSFQVKVSTVINNLCPPSAFIFQSLELEQSPLSNLSFILLSIDLFLPF